MDDIYLESKAKNRFFCFVLKIVLRCNLVLGAIFTKKKMLSSIKDKLLNVRKNVPLFSLSNDKEIVQCAGATEALNFSAGCNILSHFQNQWEVLHATNEENASKAEAMAQNIELISKKIDRDKNDLDLITHLLTTSNFKANIANCVNQLETLYNDFNTIGEKLVQLEILIEDSEMEKSKKEHLFHLEQYKVRKNDSLKVFEAKLQERYEAATVELELKVKKELQERQQVFQDAFKTDLETFKNLGTIPKLDLPKKQPSALLEEIQVEFDEQELDQFFESSS